MGRPGVEKPRNSAGCQHRKIINNQGVPEKADLAGTVHQLAFPHEDLELRSEKPHESSVPAKTVRDHYLELFNLAPVGYFILDDHNLIVDANPAGCRLLQTDKYQIKNQPFTKFITERSIESFYTHRQKTLVGDSDQTVELTMLKTDGSLFIANLESKKIASERLQVAVTDISKRKKTERELLRVNRQIEAIMECDEAIIHSVDETKLLSDICRILCTSVGYQLAVVGMVENDVYKSIRPLVWYGAEEYVLKAKESWSQTERGLGPAGTAVRTGKAQFFKDLTTEPAMAPWRESAAARDYRACIALPLTDRKGEVAAVLSLYSRSSRSFDPDEVRLLEMLADDISFAVGAMQERIKRQKAEAVISRLATFPEFNPNPILELDGEGNIKYANPAARIYFPLMVQGLEHDTVLELIIAVRKNDGHAINRDVHLGTSWFEQTLTYVPSTRSYLLYARDITVREEYEEKLRQRSAELQSSNAQLESFSYSVSHDLRAPLHSLSGFSTILLEDYAGKLDDTGKMYLEKIKESSNHMELLIEDLLKLAQISRDEMNYEKVDLSDIARKIIGALQNYEPSRKVNVNISRDIIAYGDRVLLGQVLENLLGNAWKFTSKIPESRIEMGVVEKDGKQTYFVRDNGAGFNMEHAGRLFKPFQRLHAASDFPGTGIGLAIVQQIVRRHGGEVRAEGKVGEGAAFYFTLS